MEALLVEVFREAIKTSIIDGTLDMSWMLPRDRNYVKAALGLLKAPRKFIGAKL
jgi:hypothetical protein